MGTLGAKTSQWRPGHVPYLPHPRYATGVVHRVRDCTIRNTKTQLAGDAMMLEIIFNILESKS